MLRLKKLYIQVSSFLFYVSYLHSKYSDYNVFRSYRNNFLLKQKLLAQIDPNYCHRLSHHFVHNNDCVDQLYQLECRSSRRAQVEDLHAYTQEPNDQEGLEIRITRVQGVFHFDFQQIIITVASGHVPATVPPPPPVGGMRK